MLNFVKYIIILVFLNISFVYSSCSSISNHSGSDCQITICENFFNEDIIGYYLSAIDIESGESNVLLFDYELTFEGCEDETIDTEFSISIDIPTLTDGTIEIASGNFKLFDLSYPSIYEEDEYGVPVETLVSSINNPIRVSVRNTDLNFNSDRLPTNSENAKFKMESYTESFTQDDIDMFTSSLFGLGRVPNGHYQFNFDIIDYGGTSDFGKSVNVFVPSYLNLISPGSSSIDDSTSTSVFISYPVFQWSGDYCSNCSNYSIRIAEYNPNEHSSLEDAINDISILPNETGFYDIGNQNTAFQYPVIGIQNLLPGKFYVWQVKRSYEATYGTQDEISEIFIFKMKSFDDIQFEDTSENEDILNNIKQLIGENNFNEIFGEDGILFNFNNASSTISVKGQEKSIDYILELIQKLNNGEIEVQEVEVE